MAKTRKNRKKKKDKKTEIKYDNFGNIKFITHNKYMAIRLVDKKIKSTGINKNRLTKKKRQLIPYIEEEYKNRLIKLLKKKTILSLHNKTENKKIKSSYVEKYVNKLNTKNTEELYLKLLKLTSTQK